MDGRHDSTGNNTSHMELHYLLGYVRNTEELWVGGFQLYYKYPAGQQTSNSTTVVYDSLYGGYTTDDGECFYTRVSGDIHFTLDQIGASDLPIDVKDSKSLFN